MPVWDRIDPRTRFAGTFQAAGEGRLVLSSLVEVGLLAVHPSLSCLLRAAASALLVVGKVQGLTLEDGIDQGPGRLG